MNRIHQLINQIYNQLKPYVVLALALMITLNLIFIFKTQLSSLAEILFSEKTKHNGEMLKIVASTLGGVAVIFGVLASFRRSKAMEDNVANQTKQLVIQSDNLEVAQKSLINEQFKIAIEHLADDKSTVVLGSVYELDRLAEENTELTKTIFEILCGAIREMTSASNMENYRNDTNVYPEIVLQTILDLLFINETRIKYYGFIANLSRAHLLNLSLNNAHLESANMDEIDLGNVTFFDANLKDSKINNSNISNCKFNRANLSGTQLFFTTFSQSNFANVDFSNADLSLSNIDFDHNHNQANNSQFEGALFYHALLMETGIEEYIDTTINLPFPNSLKEN